MLIKKIVLLGLLLAACFGAGVIVYGIFYLLETHVPQFYIKDVGPEKIIEIVERLHGLPFWLFAINAIRSLAIMIIPTVVGVVLIRESQRLIDFLKEAPKYPPVVFIWGITAFIIAIIQSLDFVWIESLQVQIDTIQELFVYGSVAAYALYVFVFQARRAYSKTELL